MVQPANRRLVTEATLPALARAAMGVAWVFPVLAVGANYDGGYRKVRYRKVGDEVTGRGVWVSSTDTAVNTTIYTLPVGSRPSESEVELTRVGGTVGQLEVLPSGIVKASTFAGGAAGPIPAGAVVYLNFRFSIL